MIVYRIGKTKHASELTGEGAGLLGGRWNHPRTPCIYTAESRALSLLEYTAHVSKDDIPRSLSFTSIEIPNHSIRELKIAELPGNWNYWPHAREPRDFGTNLLHSLKNMVLKFPSAIIQSEFIYVINPIHPWMKEVKVLTIADYAYDIRLKK